MKNSITFVKLALALGALCALGNRAFAESLAKPEPTRKIAQAMTVSFKDTVHRLKESEVGYRVAFGTHAAVYKLPKTSANYSELLGLLQSSLESGKQLQIQADANSLEIVAITVSSAQ